MGSHDSFDVRLTTGSIDPELVGLVRRQIGAWSPALPLAVPMGIEPSISRWVLYPRAVASQVLIVAVAAFVLGGHHLGPLAH